MTEAAPTPAAAGWYPDVESEGLRWWDGQHWTEHRAPSPSTPPLSSEEPPSEATGVEALTTGGEQSYHPAGHTPVRKQPMSGFAKFMIASPFLLIAAVVLGYFRAESANDPDRNNNEFTAVMACQDAVRRNLTSPTTASFSSKAVGGGPWKVTGTVDSENGFGAMVRSTYECRVVIEGGSANTTLERLGN